MAQIPDREQFRRRWASLEPGERLRLEKVMRDGRPAEDPREAALIVAAARVALIRPWFGAVHVAVAAVALVAIVLILGFRGIGGSELILGVQAFIVASQVAMLLGRRRWRRAERANLPVVERSDEGG